MTRKGARSVVVLIGGTERVPDLVAHIAYQILERLASPKDYDSISPQMINKAPAFPLVHRNAYIHTIRIVEVGVNIIVTEAPRPPGKWARRAREMGGED